MSAWIKRGFLSLAILGLLAAAPASADPFAYVANFSSDTVSVIDTATNTVVAIVPVGSSPGGVAVTPDGAFAYVTNFSSANVSVIDTATNAVVATVGVGNNPAGVAVSPAAVTSSKVKATGESPMGSPFSSTAIGSTTTSVPVGVAPGFAATGAMATSTGSVPTPTVATTVLVAVSITETVSESRFAT